LNRRHGGGNESGDEGHTNIGRRRADSILDHGDHLGVEPKKSNLRSSFCGVTKEKRANHWNLGTVKR